ncbi:MAG: DUF5615 family PIN-like protein [Nitrospirae bacterium]|nr:DUF5615 family PIN-like protein [Nitrospirota bacterium]
MKVIADENLLEPIIDYLKSLDYDVLSIRATGLSGISDDEVYQKACQEARLIVTMDKDFTRLFRFPPEKCGGIIVVKIYKRTIEETLSIFKKFYETVQEKDMAGNLVIITQDGVRIRRTVDS